MIRKQKQWKERKGKLQLIEPGLGRGELVSEIIDAILSRMVLMIKRTRYLINRCGPLYKSHFQIFA